MMHPGDLREVDDASGALDQFVYGHLAVTLPQATRPRQALKVASGYASNSKINHLAGMEERGDPIIGQRIKNLRVAAGKRQIEVAVAVGISRGHMSAIERGLRPVGRETLVALAEFFGTTIDYIAARLSEAGGVTVKDELDAAVLLVVHQLPREEVEAWLAHQMIRLKDKLRSS